MTNRLTVTTTSRAEVLRILRGCSLLIDLAPDDDTRILLRAGVMPKSFLADYLRSFQLEYPTGVLDYLISHGKVHESELYLRANRKDRIRPIATQYNVEYPDIKGRLVREPMTYNIYGRDRILAWYAASNHDFTGSRGEAHGIYLILQFFRLPRIQAIYRRHIENPKFRIPEEAK